MKKFLLIALLFIVIPQLSSAKAYLKVNKKEIIQDNRVKIYGYVKPRQKNKKVRIYRYYKDYSKKWKYIKTVKTKKKGRFTYYTRPSKDAYFRAKTKKKGKWTWGNKRKFVNVRLFPKCSDDTLFTDSIMDTDDFSHIYPLGATNPTGHVFPTDHVYIGLTDASLAQPIYAPGKIWIESISTSEHTSDEDNYTDYSINFRSCSKVHHFLMHISAISDELEQAYNKGEYLYDCSEYSTGGTDYKLCTKSARIKLEAGEIIGYAGGNTEQGALDWGTYDTRENIDGVANKDRWGDQVKHNVCPLDYYNDNTKATMYSYLGDDTSNRTVKPLCGDINQDVVGTAQGRWFLKKTETWESEDNHLALIHDAVDFATGQFSVGDEVSTIDYGEYNFTPTDSGYINRDFDQVTADGHIYCYDNDVETIIIQLINNDTLRIEGLAAEPCSVGSWSFSDNYTDFER